MDTGVRPSVPPAEVMLQPTDLLASDERLRAVAGLLRRGVLRRLGSPEVLEAGATLERTSDPCLPTAPLAR